MNSRERVKKAFNFEEPDRVPIDMGGTWVSSVSITTHDLLLEHFGLIEKKTRMRELEVQTAWVDDIFLNAFKADFYPIRLRASKKWPYKMKENKDQYYFTDRLGIVWARPKVEGHYYDMIKHPLANADLEDIKNLKLPQFDEDPSIIYKLNEEAKFLNKYTDYAIVGDFGGPGIWEQAFALRGLEQFLMDLMINEEIACILMDKILEMNKRKYEMILKEVGENIHVINTGEDLGTNDATFMSPEVYRKLIKPREKELLKFIKDRTDAKVFFHSCGAIRELIPDLIEIGVDILNPIQVDANGMETDGLKRDFGDKIIFWGGGCDTHSILNLGSEEDVEKEVKQRIKDLAPGGGFVFNAVHIIQAEVPVKNVIKMYESAFKFGQYPIT